MHVLQRIPIDHIIGAGRQRQGEHKIRRSLVEKEMTYATRSRARTDGPVASSLWLVFVYLFIYFIIRAVQRRRRETIDVQRAGPARGGPRRATTVLRAEGAAHGPARGPFSRAVPPGRAGPAHSPTSISCLNLPVFFNKGQFFSQITTYERSSIQFHCFKQNISQFTSYIKEKEHKITTYRTK